MKLNHVCEALGDPAISEFNAESFSAYRAKRLAAGVSGATLNRELVYLRAVFNELGRMGKWDGANPLASVRQFKVVDRELSFLSLAQIEALLSVLQGDVLLVTKVCLATGARWSEAESLRPVQVRAGMVNFSGTKSGKIGPCPSLNPWKQSCGRI